MAMKKFVIVKHPESSGKFLFYVPKNEILEAGDNVLCNTSHGDSIPGVCCCDSFLAYPETVCPLFGTQPQKMRYVVAKLMRTDFDISEEDEDEN